DDVLRHTGRIVGLRLAEAEGERVEPRAVAVELERALNAHAAAQCEGEYPQEAQQRAHTADAAVVPGTRDALHNDPPPDKRLGCLPSQHRSTLCCSTARVGAARTLRHAKLRRRRPYAPHTPDTPDTPDTPSTPHPPYNGRMHPTSLASPSTTERLQSTPITEYSGR